ncbi:MAG: glutamate-5-semialdehyde dehydrogenase, partial [Bifidobacteriaceae bacterium]|jgi:glutamate-5-semialdehyde dehydrogenase|nr:glutamate-5-semialdehyde dehydrogenase [Bifidobacteriaceae bacterium]
VLAALASQLLAKPAEIVAANQQDLARGQAEGLSAALLDRLRLDQPRISEIADALAQIQALADPLGQVVRGLRLAGGLQLRQIRVPLGVIGIIYEARPNVTADAAALAIKSGNAVILRGGSAAQQTNAAIVAALRAALVQVGLPADAVISIDQFGRDGAQQLMGLRGLVDLLVPRGGAGLIKTVVEQATVPVIETGVGNCHIYVDSAADLAMAQAIVLNAKTQRPSVCNAAETLLVHHEVAQAFLPLILTALDQAGVTIHGDPTTAALAPPGLVIHPATAADWATEYLSLDLAVRVVQSFDQAISHIAEYSTGHSEAIVTQSLQRAEQFVATVDAAAVLVNASTRFTDGGQFGLGAELGISTQKLHVRGPVGLQDLTCTKSVLWGQGQVRQ